ncbi:MAG: Zn-dependent protease [Pseudohongiella sp.]|nr:MAG: Zn-dependent protease [Pseudohongiella sp.]
MNFFESQDTAKRNTGKLIFLFALAVLSLIVITNLLVMLIFSFSGTGMTSMAATTRFQFDPMLFLIIGAIVSAIVLFGSLYKVSSLSGGGARIAEMMNGRLLVSGSSDPDERRVLNIVEEMAIASGTPVPPVYLMEEEGINAFAAGYSPSDAIVAVTRGSIETLSRDQLQGVIAHEFSHILHGDMRINIRLIGVLHGIMILGIIGYHLLRSGRYSRRSKNSGGIIFLGLGLVVVGFVGTFFGNLIKAAVSRQREYLADASAVQFTRNPDGIGQALMQIARSHNRSYLNNPKSSEISHALFEEAQPSALSGLYATHPPLDDRIRAILPRWSGDYDESEWDRSALAADEAEEQSSDPSGPSQREKATAILTGATGVLLADQLIDQVGNPDGKHLDYADELLHQIPALFLSAAREPSGARAVVYFLVLSKDESVRTSQLEVLQGSADVGVFDELQTLCESGESISAEQRLPLVTIALSTLRQLSQNQYQLFKSNFKHLIEIDRKISLLEWSLQKIVMHSLEAVFNKDEAPYFGKKGLKACKKSVSVLLSILTHSTAQEGLSPEETFAAGADALDLSLELIAVSEIDFEILNNALDELADLKPLQKPALLKACVSCITADGKIQAIETELLRAVAATIDCPVPPLLAD